MSGRIQLTVLVALALSTPAIADNPYRLKTGATGTACLECHVAIQETMELPHVHTPLKQGACSDCHNPHASEHGQLLATEPTQICSNCHGDIVPDDARSTHATILEGNCALCHDPHASEHKNGLAAEGNQLCFGCHETMQAKLTDSRFKHAPAADDCLNCHNPHASTEADFLLTQDTAALCGDCHDATDDTFIDSHMGYPVADSRCTSCHDPHGGETRAMFQPNIHAPLTRKMCNLCHMSPGSPDALKTKKSGIEMCRSCHSKEVKEIMASDRVHWPVADETACLHCHDPHASKHDGLLPVPTKTLCGSCHANTLKVMEASVSKHAPSDDGDCALCHSPHASNNLDLLQSASITELCTSCHDWKAHTSHPIGVDFKDQRNMNITLDCLSCHEAHGSQHRALAPKDPAGDLCVECHQQLVR